jgi:hypothetical protein
MSVSKYLRRKHESNSLLSPPAATYSVPLMRVALILDTADVCQATGADRYDLHMTPAMIERIQPARNHLPLRTLLTNLNAQNSLFATFACKVWLSSESADAEPYICASRVDLIFLSEAVNFGRGPLENLAQRLTNLLQEEPADALRVELRLASVELAGDTDGYCLRILLDARGATPEQAEVRWGLGLSRVQQALLFLARTLWRRASSENERITSG